MQNKKSWALSFAFLFLSYPVDFLFNFCVIFSFYSISYSFSVFRFAVWLPLVICILFSFFLVRERRMWKWRRYYHFNSAKFAPTLKIICIKRSDAAKMWKKTSQRIEFGYDYVSRVFKMSIQRIQKHHTTNAKPTDNLDQILCSANKKLNFIQRIILILMMILDVIWWKKWWLQINFRVLI